MRYSLWVYNFIELFNTGPCEFDKKSIDFFMRIKDGAAFYFFQLDEVDVHLEELREMVVKKCRSAVTHVFP